MAEFTCEQCGKSFRWTTALAGRRAKCPCGATIICPDYPPEDPNDVGEYDLAASSPRVETTRSARAPGIIAPGVIATAAATSPPAGTATTTSPTTAPPTAASRASPTAADPNPGDALPPRPAPLAYRSAPTAPGQADPDALKNFQIPLWLLIGGVIVNVAAMFLVQGRNLESALKQVGTQLILGTIVMLIGVLIAVRARGISLGGFWIAVFKLAAISVAPSGVVALASPALNRIFLGGIVGWVIEFILYFALLGVLFDLDESDTWYCVCVIFVVNVGVYFLNMASTIKLF
jgi:hypothetical protein